MKASDIPLVVGYRRLKVPLLALLQRAESGSRISWTDLPDETGIYVIFWPQLNAPLFRAHAGKAVWAVCANPKALERKWQLICHTRATDILYIGKGSNLKQRIRFLARFGVGKAANHRGGEWVWQVQGIETAQLLIQTCPPGRETAFENWLLERHFIEHGAFPLVNRRGPVGTDRWSPQSVACYRDTESGLFQERSTPNREGSGKP